MAQIDPGPAGPVAGIAEPHQSTVATILRAAGLGLFTSAEADMLIDRIRAHTIPVPGAAPVRGSHDHGHGGSSATTLLFPARAGDHSQSDSR